MNLRMPTSLTVPLPNPLEPKELLDELAAANAGVDGLYASGADLILSSANVINEPVAREVVATHAPKAAAAREQRATEQTNESTIRDRAAQALDANTAFLAIASPTNAQTLAQVKALTRQNNGIIRLLLRKLDGTD